MLTGAPARGRTARQMMLSTVLATLMLGLFAAGGEAAVVTNGSPVTTYNPINLCMAQGDYIAFNDEGGFVERYYRSGVAYRVLAPTAGSSANSYIKAGGTNNGDVMSSSTRSNMDGFAVNNNT